MYRFLYGIVIGIVAITIISEVVLLISDPSFFTFCLILISGFLIAAIFIALAEIYNYVKASYHVVESAYSNQTVGKKAYPEVGKQRH